MGRQHFVYMDQRQAVCCKKCGVHLSTEPYLVSKEFVGSTGEAHLYRKA